VKHFAGCVGIFVYNRGMNKRGYRMNTEKTYADCFTYILRDVADRNRKLHIALKQRRELDIHIDQMIDSAKASEQLLIALQEVPSLIVIGATPTIESLTTAIARLSQECDALRKELDDDEDIDVMGIYSSPGRVKLDIVSMKLSLLKKALDALITWESDIRALHILRNTHD
jgi:hypothetical protein